MTFNEAIVKSVRSYFNGRDPENLNKIIIDQQEELESNEGEQEEQEKSTSPIKYTREYMNDLEERILSGEDISDMEEDKPKKRKRGRPRKEKEVVEDAVLVEDEDEDMPMNGLLMPLN
tara:strand:+ start:824 stop:1177 length:354 start_codon:yes stop_codon:yes gene_type:complete